jgi:hypothetical protein
MAQSTWLYFAIAVGLLAAVLLAWRLKRGG